ncbi:MAG: DUF3833 domain-containing protein [Pseudomonadota bacterium]
MIGKFKTLSLFIISLLILSGCGTVNVQDYQNLNPELRIEDYFQGETKAWGIFQERFGKVRRRFTVDIVGTWDEAEQTLKLVEDFDYDDGEKEQRIWTINKTGENTYTGSADGVVGEATGITSGNAFNFKYTFDLPVEGKTWRVKFDDWMYLQDDNVLFNKATIYRWGFRLGDVYIFFDKRNK